MVGTITDLPTVEECRAFLDAINAERATGDLEPLRVLDFDGADPGSDANCLSARNCYWPLGYYVGCAGVWKLTDRNARPIPASILRVTKVFDGARDEATLAALRARLVEAGVVEP